MPVGTVKWYDISKGFGFVSLPGESDVYVSSGAIIPGVGPLVAGQHVEFEVVPGRRGPQARNLRWYVSPAPPPAAVGDPGPSSPAVGPEIDEHQRLSGAPVSRSGDVPGPGDAEGWRRRLRWEYATLFCSSQVLTVGGVRWNIVARVGVEMKVVLTEQSEAPETLKWCSWMGDQGWDLVHGDIAHRYFYYDSNARHEPVPAHYRFYFKRPAES